MAKESKDTKANNWVSVNHAQLHSSFMWPGLPKIDAATLSDTKYKGLKMKYGPMGLELKMGDKYAVVPVPSVKFISLDGPVYSED